MSLVQRAKLLISSISSIKECIKYGGDIKANISTIQYGSLFNKDTHVLITGGGSGIGLAMAQKFLEQGAKVCVVGRNKTKLETVRKEINNENFRIYACDISDVKNVSTNIDAIENIMGGPLTILINNAGVYSKTHFPNCTEEDWDDVYNINAKGTFFLCQEVCKRWINNRVVGITRNIINISSQGGFVGANNPYRMTKWDIRGLTEFLGKEMCKYGIVVNGIAPGIVMTDMQSEFQKQKDNLFTYLTPVKRLGLPLEIAELAVYLASDASNFIIGQTIVCDGGYILK